MSKAYVLGSASANKVRQICAEGDNFNRHLRKYLGTRQVSFVRVTGEQDENGTYPCVIVTPKLGEFLEEPAEAIVWSSSAAELSQDTVYLALRDGNGGGDLPQFVADAGSGDGVSWVKITSDEPDGDLWSAQQQAYLNTDFVDVGECCVKLRAGTLFIQDEVYLATRGGTVVLEDDTLPLFHAKGHNERTLTMCVDGQDVCERWLIPASWSWSEVECEEE